MRAGLPHSEIPGSKLGYQLPWAYRRFQRPSSPLDAKTSTVSPCTLGQSDPTPTPGDPFERAAEAGTREPRSPHDRREASRHFDSSRRSTLGSRCHSRCGVHREICCVFYCHHDLSKSLGRHPSIRVPPVADGCFQPFRPEISRLRRGVPYGCPSVSRAGHCTESSATVNGPRQP